MKRSVKTSDPMPYPVRIPALAIAAVLALSALLGSTGIAAASTAKVVAKKGPVEALNATVLTSLKGRTLYSLSAEKNGKFICTGSCESTWKPLTVTKGTKPKGPVALGTTTRPNGVTQVTYKGLPLYTFTGDSKSGEANGEGFKDVGTWHAAKVGKLSSPQPQPQPEQPYTPPYPY